MINRKNTALVMANRLALHFKCCWRCKEFKWIREHWDGRPDKDIFKRYFCLDCNLEVDLQVRVSDNDSVVWVYDDSSDGSSSNKTGLDFDTGSTRSSSREL